METINVALIGRGYWGSKLEEYIKKNPHMKLVAVCDAQSDLHKEIYKNPDIEAVFVATPDETHYQIVKNILVNKKHVMCEKPLALTKKECLELERLATKRKVVLCVDYTHTFSGALHVAKELIAKGVLGKIQAIEMRMKQLGPFGRENVYWLSASHMLSILDMFVGLKKLTFYKKDLLVYRGKVETGIIYFNSDAVNGEILVSLNDPRKERQVIIYGQNGSIMYNPLAVKSLQLIIYKRVFQTVLQPSVNSKFFNFDELHNLKHTVEYFYNTIKQKSESNIKRAVLVTEILEKLNNHG